MLSQVYLFLNGANDLFLGTNEYVTVSALSEAQDISKYLKPLSKHLTQLEETDFAECAPLLAPLMHVVCLVWCNSNHYCQVKFIVLLKQINNLLIQQVM